MTFYLSSGFSKKSHGKRMDGKMRKKRQRHVGRDDPGAP
jgi:hypothetical protein